MTQPLASFLGAAGASEAGALEALRPHRGTVTAFDEAVGLGVVEDSDGSGCRYSFHCTQIADGSRTIALGAVVWFSVVVGRQGRWEAAAVTS